MRYGWRGKHAVKKLHDTGVFGESIAVGGGNGMNVIVGAYGEKATYQANLSVCDEIEIIGSVHSNPELLEVENENSSLHIQDSM